VSLLAIGVVDIFKTLMPERAESRVLADIISTLQRLVDLAVCWYTCHEAQCINTVLSYFPEEVVNDVVVP
jgi:hypothetical protein